MPSSNQGDGPWGTGPQQSRASLPDLEQCLRRSQDKLRNVLPGGNLGGRGLSVLVLAALAIWGFFGFFRVDPDELGVVLRFGQYVRDAKPGLNYHLPYLIESVLTPKVTRVNGIDIGMRVVGGTAMRDVPGTVKAVAESAMREIVGRSTFQPVLTRETAYRDRRARANAVDAG